MKRIEKNIIIFLSLFLLISSCSIKSVNNQKLSVNYKDSIYVIKQNSNLVFHNIKDSSINCKYPQSKQFFSLDSLLNNAPKTNLTTLYDSIFKLEHDLDNKVLDSILIRYKKMRDKIQPQKEIFTTYDIGYYKWNDSIVSIGVFCEYPTYYKKYLLNFKYNELTSMVITEKKGKLDLFYENITLNSTTKYEKDVFIQT